MLRHVAQPESIPFVTLLWLVLLRLPYNDLVVMLLNFNHDFLGLRFAVLITQLGR